jgi:hypothetical protein
VLASFSGSVEDLLVLAHEVGHELEPGPGFRDGWTGVGDPASACRAALAEVERRLTALERTFLEATGAEPVSPVPMPARR